MANFYDYLYRNDVIDSAICDKLMKKVFSDAGFKGYKSFMEQHSGGQAYSKNILKIIEPKKRVGILTKEQRDVGVLNEKYGINYNRSKGDYS